MMKLKHAKTQTIGNEPCYITNQSGLSSADFDPDLNNNIVTIDTQILESAECAEAVDLSARLTKIKSKGKFKKKTGEWQFKVNTKVEICNNGTQCAPPTVVKLYLSDDPFIDESDTLLDTKSVKTICPGKKPKKVKFKVKLGNDQNPVGRYIIAVADGDNTVPECNEENNMAAGF